MEAGLLICYCFSFEPEGFIVWPSGILFCFFSTIRQLSPWTRLIAFLLIDQQHKPSRRRPSHFFLGMPGQCFKSWPLDDEYRDINPTWRPRTSSSDGSYCPKTIQYIVELSDRWTDWQRQARDRRLRIASHIKNLTQAFHVDCLERLRVRSAAHSDTYCNTKNLKEADLLGKTNICPYTCSYEQAYSPNQAEIQTKTDKTRKNNTCNYQLQTLRNSPHSEHTAVRLLTVGIQS